MCKRVLIFPIKETQMVDNTFKKCSIKYCWQIYMYRWNLLDDFFRIHPCLSTVWLGWSVSVTWPEYRLIYLFSGKSQELPLDWHLSEFCSVSWCPHPSPACLSPNCYENRATAYSTKVLVTDQSCQESAGPGSWPCCLRSSLLKMRSEQSCSIKAPPVQRRLLWEPR